MHVISSSLAAIDVVSNVIIIGVTSLMTQGGGVGVSTMWACVGGVGRRGREGGSRYDHIR